MKTDIVFVERIFPLYRKAVYDTIYQRKKFIFFHSIDSKSGIKQTRAEYSSLVKSLHYGKKESSVFLFVLQKLFFVKPQIVIHEFSAGILSKLWLVLICKLSKTKLIFWGHMYDRAKGFSPQYSLFDKYRLWLWKKADSLITYSETEKRLLVDYKIPSDKIFVAYNTVDTNALLKIRKELEQIGKPTLKKQINFEHEYNLIFIGRLYKGKKPEILLNLLEGLKQKGFNSVAVHYVGEGEMISHLKQKAIQLNLQSDVFFHGAVYDERFTGEMLFCSDLMIMPGCVGLSVNHSFCFNCPVVTFKEINLDPAHGPEVEYIINRKTGFLIEEHSDKALVEIVADYLKSNELRNTMGAEIKDFIEKKCSVENMAGGVLAAIDYNLKETI